MEGSRLPRPIHQEIAISTFATLGLRVELTRAVAEQGYTDPTPIQSQAIPVVLAGRDLLGAAQTGTGKTAGFTLPLLQRLAAERDAGTAPAHRPGAAPRRPRALILTPTRELAAQVEESVRDYGRHLKLTSTVIFGGVGFTPQVETLRRGVDIVVATPGRLLDHHGERTIDLRGIEILVLDEADRMLDMGFIPDIRRILALLPAQRQNLLFSATFPDEIRKLSGSFMRDPVTVEVAPRNRPVELISQAAYPVHKERKRELLAHLVKSGAWRQVLVFTRTKHGANRLAQQLEREGIEADAIHGNKSQGARTRALARFKANELTVLVATDIAARGLDIEELPHVVNYDLPHVAEDYVHRIGRTGRAGASGEAVSLVCADDRPLLAAIERLIGRRIEQRSVSGYDTGAGTAAPSGRQPAEQPQQRSPARQQAAPAQPARQGRRRRRGGRGRTEERRDTPQPGNAPHARNDGSRHQQRPGGQQRHGGGNAGPGRHRDHRPEPRVPSYGNAQFAPQRAEAPAARDQRPDEDRQPTPERAKNQLFPAFLGLFRRGKAR